jgi:hypothetical protein
MSATATTMSSLRSKKLGTTNNSKMFVATDENFRKKNSEANLNPRGAVGSRTTATTENDDFSSKNGEKPPLTPSNGSGKGFNFSRKSNMS